MTHIPDELKKMLIADVKNALTLNLMPEEIMALARLFEISISQFYKDKSALTPEHLEKLWIQNVGKSVVMPKDTFFRLFQNYQINKPTLTTEQLRNIFDENADMQILIGEMGISKATYDNTTWRYGISKETFIRLAQQIQDKITKNE